MFTEDVNSFMSKFNNFKLNEVCYDNSSKLLSVKFITSNLDDNSKQELENQLKLALNTDVEILYKYIKPIEDFKFYYDILNNHFVAKYNYKNFTKDDLQVKFDDKISISIILDDTFDLVYKLSEVKEDVCNLFKNHTFKEIEVDINYKNENLLKDNPDTLLTLRNELLNEYEENYNAVQKTFKINGLDIVVGKDFDNVVMCLNQIVEEADNVQIAGKVKFLAERTFIKKGKNEEDEDVERKYYTFELVDGFGKIHVTYFPTKAYLQGEKKLDDGQIVTLYGKVQNYRDSLTFTARGIAYCCLPIGQLQEAVVPNPNVIKIKQDDENESDNEVIEYLPEPDNYLKVFPLAYIEPNQIDMFSIINNSTETTPKLLKDKDYVVFDLETTGLDYKVNEILEIGAVKIRNGKIIETFNVLCKPYGTISDEITNLTGISYDLVKNADRFSDIVADFYKFTRGSALVAHNASFDVPFLNFHAKKCKYNFDNDVFDTLVMARKLVKGVRNYKLGTLSEYFNIELKNAHRALFDTLATAKCFIELCKLDN